MEWNKDIYCRDLSDFANIIDKYDSDSIFGKVTSSLHGASAKLKGSQKYSLKLEDIDCKINKSVSKTIPDRICTLVVYFDYCCEFDTSKEKTQEDLIKEYSFQLEIVGKKDNKDYRCAWHLDRDKRDPGDGTQKFTHPLYHFQYGGNKMMGLNDTGDTLIIGAPRLPHPPMDIFLVIHFILNNFISRKDYDFLVKILENEAYIDIIRRAQSRMFKPYFSAFNENNQHQDFTVKNIFPLAV